MASIFCSLGCSRRVYHTAYAEQAMGYVICSVCRNNGSFSNHVKSAYKLVDQSAFDTLKKEKEDLKHESQRLFQQRIEKCFFLKYFEKGEGLANFITEKLADYMHQYNLFVQNIAKQQSCLKGYLKQSVRRITKSIEKAVMGFISNEAQTLSTNIQTENTDNQKRIKASQLSRDFIKKKLTNEKIETSHRDLNEDNKDENPIITEHIYQKAEADQFQKLLNANVQRYKANATVLFKLKAEGEKIAGQLSREDKGSLDITLDTTIASEQEILKLEIKE